MKRFVFPLCWVQLGIALSVLTIGPVAWATDGQYSAGPAELDFDTGQLFRSQHPNHPVACAAGMVCAGLTVSGTGTATGTGTGTFYIRDDVPLTVSTTATGTGDVSGSGTVSYLPKWGTASGTSTATTKTLSDSVIRQHTALGATSLQIAGFLDPVTDGAYEMGYDTKRWLNLHLKGKTFFYGATSGYVGVQSPSVATSYTLTLPPNDGDAGQFLQTNGAGVASWAFATDLGTATASHVLVFPNATHTVTSTVTITETDLAQTTAGASKIPMAGTNSKIDIGWLPTGTSTATSVLITGGDSRLVPAVMVLPNNNKTVSGTFTVNTTDVAMTTPTPSNIPLAKTDGKIDVGWLPTGTTAGTIPIRDGSGHIPGHATLDLMANGVSCSGANSIYATNGQITSCSAAKPAVVFYLHAGATLTSSATVGYTYVYRSSFAPGYTNWTWWVCWAQDGGTAMRATLASTLKPGVSTYIDISRTDNVWTCGSGPLGPTFTDDTDLFYVNLGAGGAGSPRVGAVFITGQP